MIKYLIVALIVYLIVSQFLFIKEGFNSHVNAYIRPKIRQLRLNKETFITKYIFSQDHKMIAKQYLITGVLFMGVIGILMSLLM